MPNISELYGSTHLPPVPLQQVKTVGADDFIAKPVDLSTLMVMVEHHAVHVPLRILLVDDSFALRLTMKAILEGSCGHKVTVAENGREGLDAMKAGTYDLTLSDIQMPVLDGFEMAQALRVWETDHRPSWRQPLVLMSANSSPEERTRVRRLCQRVWMSESLNVCVCVCDCMGIPIRRSMSHTHCMVNEMCLNTHLT